MAIAKKFVLQLFPESESLLPWWHVLWHRLGGSLPVRHLSYYVVSPRQVKLTQLVVEPPTGMTAEIVSFAVSRFREYYPEPHMVAGIMVHPNECATVELDVRGLGIPRVFLLGVQDDGGRMWRRPTHRPDAESEGGDHGND